MSKESENEVDVVGESRGILGGLDPEKTSLITLLQRVQDHFGFDDSE